MKAIKENTAPYFFKAWKLLGLAMLFILISQISYAQNTKGAEVGGGATKQKRESRFRIPTKKKKQKSSSASFKRVRGRSTSSANSARRTSASSKPGKVYPQSGRFVNHSSRGNNQKAWKGDITGRRIRAPRSREKTRNVYPQYGRYVNNASRKPKDKQTNVTSNRATLSRLNKLQGNQSKSASGGRKQVVIPRSASHSFIARKSINVYANFPRPKPKKEKAHIKDITGRKLRTKNFETPKPKIATPTFKPSYGRSKVSDQPYKGKASGSYQSASKRSERSWKGNISGNKIRGRNYSSKPRIEGLPISPSKTRRPKGKDRLYRGAIPGGGFRSATQPGEFRTGKRPLPVRTPGAGAARAGTFQGSLKRGRATPLYGNQGESFSGFKKTRRPFKGGGSVSGRSWNNKLSALPKRTPSKDAMRSANYQGSFRRLGTSVPGYTNQGEGFTGYKKTRRPLKGGGSVSGRSWNNKLSALPKRTPSRDAMRSANYQGSFRRLGTSVPGYADQGEGFTGYKKARRPLKGGGSVSGRTWNNKLSALPKRVPSKDAQRSASFQGNFKRPGTSVPGFADQGEGFSGYTKARRPVKGGGSISGRLWNNKEKPIPPRTPPPAAQRAGRYQGSIKRFEQSPTFMDQGEQFTGYIKLRRLRKNYIKNPNAAEEALKKKYPDKSTYSVGGLQVKVKEREYVQNKNAAEKSILKKKPTQSTYYVDGLQVKVKEREYGKKPHAAKGSMPGVKPSQSSVKASEYARGVKRTWNYIHNPSSADEAQKTREPGKAFGKITDYQGNIKMQKFHLFEKNRHLHPDATFVKTNKNNVDGERDLLTNVKLWWAKLFKKQDTQPDNLKDKGKRPRYDKREDGLWYD